MSTDMINVEDKELRAMVLRQLTKVNMLPDDASIVADVLVSADLRGVHSHGVLRVEHYVNRIHRGGMNLRPILSFKRIKDSIGLVDAQGCSGAVSMRYAMDEAMKTAGREGICLAGVKNNSHCGALAYYVQMALDAGMISVVMCNTDSCVVPLGGRVSYFGSNPLAFGYPGEKESILLDMATSEVAFGKIYYAQERKQSIPEGWGVDDEGNTCTNPDNVKALLPFGGGKGYGINLMVEALTGLLIGGFFGPYVTKMYEDLDKARNVSNFIFLIDPAQFDESGGFLESCQKMIDELHALPAAPGVERVLIPGEIERLKMERSLMEGIEIPRSVYDFLKGK